MRLQIQRAVSASLDTFALRTNTKLSKIGFAARTLPPALMSSRLQKCNM
jgi:hypothetical protein